MITITINRHKRVSGNWPMPGDLIESQKWGSDVVPRCGDLVTVHPDSDPSELSWTGVVTGVQHVYRYPKDGYAMAPHAVVTVCDEGQIQKRQS